MKKKILVFVAIALCVIFILRERSGYSVDKAAVYVTEHAESRSHNCCALYVMKAMYAAGQPVPLLRACDYKWYFRHVLTHQFQEVSIDRYRPQKGDIVVFPSVPNHFFGHIAMWNGKQWVSDFKQRNFIVSREYSRDNCAIFRPVG